MKSKKRQRNFKNGDWSTFYEKVEILFTRNAPNIFKNSQEIPKKRIISIQWNEECGEIVKKRKDALRKFNKEMSMQNYFEMKNQMALANKFLKKKRKEHFCYNLKRNTKIKKIWKTIRFMKNNATDLN